MNLSRQDREAVFNKVCRLVETKHFNPRPNDVDWNSVVEGGRQAWSADDCFTVLW